jgi:hypothetical protein
MRSRSTGWTSGWALSADALACSALSCMQAGTSSSTLLALTVTQAVGQAVGLTGFVLHAQLLAPDKARQMSPLELEAALRSVLLKQQYTKDILQPLPAGASTHFGHIQGTIPFHDIPDSRAMWHKCSVCLASTNYHVLITLHTRLHLHDAGVHERRGRAATGHLGRGSGRACCGVWLLKLQA